jgi:hypothetical protein
MTSSLPANGSRATSALDTRSLRGLDFGMYGNDINLFMIGELAIAWNSGLEVKHRPVGTGGASSAKMARFLTTPLNMAMGGLYGCTAAVVVSEQGVWMAHLWEVPSFTSQENFVQDVLNVLRDGDTSLDGEGNPWVPGLAQFGGLGKEFDMAQNPHIIIVTPREQNPLKTGRALEYEGMINQLITELRTCIPNFRLAIFDYVPIDDFITNITTAKGKVLVQYTPVQAILPDLPPSHPPLQMAMLRVYIEDELKPFYEHKWLADATQIV